jgi:serine protease AprX
METASIDYIVPTGSYVTLTVYDIYSRRVASLVSEYKAAGHHSAAFHARELPGGTYIYRLESAGTSISRTMTLLK